MNKNVAGQQVTLLVIDTATNLPKTGDAANLTAYVKKDGGAVTALTDTSATEEDATNAPGLYTFDVAQAETNADRLLFSGKSSTSGVRVIPLTVYTRPVNASALSVDSNGKVLLQPTQTGVTIPTVTNLTNLPAAPANWLDGPAVKADAVTKIQTGLATTSQIDALNQSASRRVLLVSSPQYERPESGNNTYVIEARTWDGDGAAVNADSPPTLTAIGVISGSLAGKLGSISNPSTGVYRWNYTVGSSDTLEQVRLDFSATIAASAFTTSYYTQVADFVAATFTTADRADIAAIKSKTDNLPATPADGSTIATSFSGVNSKLDAIDDFVDTEVAAIKAKTDLIPASPASASDIPTADQNAIGLLDKPNAIENGETLKQSLMSIMAATAGASDGAGTATMNFKNPAKTKNRITATLDGNGNRTNIAKDFS